MLWHTNNIALLQAGDFMIVVCASKSHFNFTYLQYRYSSNTYLFICVMFVIIFMVYYNNKFNFLYPFLLIPIAFRLAYCHFVAEYSTQYQYVLIIKHDLLLFTPMTPYK